MEGGSRRLATLSHGWRHWNCNASTAHSFPVFKQELSSVGSQRLQEREHDKVAQYFYYPTVHLASFTCWMHASKGLFLAVPCKLCFYLSNNTLAKSLHHCSLLPSFPPETSQAPAIVSGLCRDTTSWCSAPQKYLFHSRLRTSPAQILPVSPPLAPSFTFHVLEMPLTPQNLQNFCLTAFFTQL